MMAYTGMEVRKELQGVVLIVGMAWCEMEPSDSSMYLSSVIEMKGCFEGRSKAIHSHTVNHMTPRNPRQIEIFKILLTQFVT